MTAPAIVQQRAPSRGVQHNADLLYEVRDDWWAAQESRRSLEERRLRDYRLYRRFRDDVVDFGFEEAVKGPFNWSSITIPLIYWIVETIVPRVATVPPTLLVKPGTPESLPYAQAKELALRSTVERMGIENAQQHALKQMVLYGDGPTKTTWNADKGCPRFTSIPWWDFFVSSEARSIDDAEVQFHRTWLTRRQLMRLSRVTDRDGNPLFHGLDRVERTETIEVGDSTWNARREAAGLGPQSWSALGGLYCLVECWYDDGTVVVLGGAQGDHIVQLRTSPFRDERDRPIRPFVNFPNSGDPEGPYSIGDAEMLEDHQQEASTIRNQGMDATTASIWSPVVYSDGMVTKAEVDAGFGQPGGTLKVTGDVREAVMRMAPGSISPDLYNMVGMIREEAQFVSGVNDNVAGQAAEREQTATEIRLINQEANVRWRYKVLRTETAFAQVGRLVDLHERRYGVPTRSLLVPPGFAAMPGQEGLLDTTTGQPYGPGQLTPEGGAYLRTSPLVDGPGTAYVVSVKAGSLALSTDEERVQKTLNMAAALSAPQIAPMVRWRVLAERIVTDFGEPPEKYLLSEEEQAQAEADALMAELQNAIANTPAPAGNESAGAPAPTPA